MYGDKQIKAYTTSEYQKRILLRMGKDQYEIANLLKKQLDRATIHYERSIRDKDSAIDLDIGKAIEEWYAVLLTILLIISKIKLKESRCHINTQTLVKNTVRFYKK